jgi:hypothetical protein
MRVGRDTKVRIFFFFYFSHSWVVSTKFEFPNIFHTNPSAVCRVFPYGQTDGHDEANFQFSLLRERAKMSVLLRM